MCGCLNSLPEREILGKNCDNFQKEAADYDSKIQKATEVTLLIRQNLKINPSDQKKKALLTQLAKAQLLLKVVFL